MSPRLRPRFCCNWRFEGDPRGPSPRRCTSSPNPISSIRMVMAFAREVDIVPARSACHALESVLTALWSDTMRYWAKSSPAVFLPLFLLAFLTSSGNSQNQTESKVVYVCACLKTKSCSCMTEAKMEGPCACGTEGGPPLKAVPKDSAWAKENREALAK